MQWDETMEWVSLDECNGMRPWNGSVLTGIQNKTEYGNGNRSSHSQVVKSQTH